MPDPDSLVRSKSQKTWGATPAGTAHAPDLIPGTKEFFARVYARRAEHEIPWLYELIPFQRFKDLRVLEIGCGAGYDAYDLLRNGAHYTGIDITPENPSRTREHLRAYNLSPNVIVGDAQSLMFAGQSFDVVFSNGVLQHTGDIEKCLHEAWRVLKPDGALWIIVYYKHSIFYWLTLFLFDHVLKRGYRHRTFQERLGMIEFNRSGIMPVVNVYSKRQLRKLLEATGFRNSRMWIRKLVVEDLPPIPVIADYWHLVPRRILDRIGKLFGWYVVVNARKRNRE